MAGVRATTARRGLAASRWPLAVLDDARTTLSYWHAINIQRTLPANTAAALLLRDTHLDTVWAQF